MSKHSKSSVGKPHPQPNNGSAGNQKRSVTGDVHVSGEITLKPTPEEKLSRKTADQKNDAKDNEKKWLDRVTLIVLTIYAGLTFWQGYSTQQIVTLTKKQLTASQRPYILIPRINEVSPFSGHLAFNLNDVNYGTAPALHYLYKSMVIVGPNALTEADNFFMSAGNQKFEDDGTGSISIIPPGVPPNIVNPDTTKVDFITVISRGSYTQEQLDRFRSQDKQIVIVLRGQYNDISGSTYQTDYCAMALSTHHIAQCPKHNDIREIK